MRWNFGQGIVESHLEQPRNVAVVEFGPAGAVGLGLGLGSKELLLLAVDNVLATVEVGFVGLDTAALCDQHVTKDENQEERNAQVGGDEGGVVKRLALQDEDTIVLGQGNDAAEE